MSYHRIRENLYSLEIHNFTHTMPSGTQKPKSVHKDIHTYKCDTKVKCTNRQLILQDNIFAIFYNHY
jgi:hypothetical protein